MATATDVIAITSAFYGVDAERVTSRTRTRAVTQARQVAQWLLRQESVLSSAEIGLFFGGRDHSTVLHAIDAVEQRRRTDALFRAETDVLLARVQGRPGTAELAALTRAQQARRDEATIARGQAREEAAVNQLAGMEA